MPRSSEDAPEKGEAKSPPPRSTAPSLVGEVISGRYRVTELIATGGMSSVYLGQHVHMMKRVAIKVLDPKAEQLPELVARFQREAIAGAHVQHPNIASATDFGQLKDGSYFLVLEYVPGTTLNQLIAKGPVGVRRAVGIAKQIASGLGAAHEVGVVHRDVKPTNVILLEGSNDVVKLIDFGFAQVKLSKVPSLAPPPDEPATAEKMLTQAGVVLGTVAYMSPEAALGMGAVDQRSDLYALGLILYELLSGKHPFEAPEPVRLFLQQRTVPPPAIATRSPGVSVPPALEAVVMKLLAKDPKDRYQSAAEVVSALDTAMMSLAFEMVPDLSSISESGGLFGAKADDVPAPKAPPPKPAVLSKPSPSDQLPTIALGVPPSFGPLPPPNPPPLPGVAALVEPEPSAEIAVPEVNSIPVADPFAKVSEFVRRVPGVAALEKVLPKNGRFPPWAYIAAPLLAILFIVVMFSLARRSSRASGETGRTERVLVPSPLDDMQPAPIERGPYMVQKPSEVVPDAGGLDAAGWRMTLRNAVREKDWAKGTEAVFTLMHADPDAFRDRDVQNGMRAVAVALGDAGGEPADKFFGALTSETGSDGLDLLYDISRFRGWTKAGKRATDTLRNPEVLMRASSPLKVLFDFREASCMGKRDAFGKMAEQGDDRALFELTSLRDAECRRRHDACCFNESKALNDAIKSLKARLASAKQQPAPPTQP
jgi:serine/threonine-protein kinase